MFLSRHFVFKRLEKVNVLKITKINGRVSLTNALKSPGSILPTYENMYSHSNNPESNSSVPTICKICDNINKILVGKFQAPARISALECFSTEIGDLRKFLIVYTNFSSIISWEYVNLKSSNPVSKAELSSFQVELFDNGNIRMSYGNLSISDDKNCAIGYEDPNYLSSTIEYFGYLAPTAGCISNGLCANKLQSGGGVKILVF